MLRAGLSNRQIAERLGISYRAARYHVSEIFSRLGVANRHEAARWTPEKGEEVWWRKIRGFLDATPKSVPLYLARGLGIAIIVAAVASLGLLAVGVLRTGGSEGPRESRILGAHPSAPTPTTIPGLTYDIVYRVIDGTIMALGQHMEGEPVSAIVEDGQALLQLADSPQVREDLRDFGDVIVNTETMQVEYRPGRPCRGHPLLGEDPDCMGYAYELVYWEADGKINSFGIYDACGPPYYDCSATRPAAILQPGQDWMNLAGDDRVKDLMQNMESYYVDVDTRELKKR